MSLLEQLSSSTGRKESNKEVVENCLRTPALLHTVAEGLRTGTPTAQEDCAEILAEVAAIRPDSLSDFVSDFLDASRSPNKKIAKLGFAGLVKIVSAKPADIFAEREYLLETAKANTPIGLGATAVVAALCGQNANYRGKLLGNLLRLVPAVEEKQLPRWVETAAPAVAGSLESIKRLTSALTPRLTALPDPAKKKIDKLIKKMERSAK